MQLGCLDLSYQPLPGCVTLGKLLNQSGPQLLHLQKGGMCDRSRCSIGQNSWFVDLSQSLGSVYSSALGIIVTILFSMEACYWRVTYIQKSAWIIKVKRSELSKSDASKGAVRSTDKALAEPQKHCHGSVSSLTPFPRGLTIIQVSNKCGFVFVSFWTLHQWSHTGCTVFVWFTLLHIFVRVILCFSR